MEKTSNWTPTLTPPASPTARIPWSRPSSHCCLQKAVWVPCSTLTCVILVLLEETVLCPDCCSPPRPWPVDSQPLAKAQGSARSGCFSSQDTLFQLILEKVPMGHLGLWGKPKSGFPGTLGPVQSSVWSLIHFGRHVDTLLSVQ